MALIYLEKPLTYSMPMSFAKSTVFDLEKTLQTYIQSRMMYSAEILGFDWKQSYIDGLGFFVTKSEIEISNIPTTQERIQAVSQIEAYQESHSTKLLIPFKIFDPQQIYASGIVEFTVVDLKQVKARLLPQDYWKYFDGDPNFQKLQMLETKRQDFAKAFQFQTPEHSKEEYIYRGSVADADIDDYQHVNTAVYSRYLKAAFAQMQKELKLDANLQIHQAQSKYVGSLLKGETFTVTFETLRQNEDLLLRYKIRNVGSERLMNSGLLHITKPD